MGISAGVLGVVGGLSGLFGGSSVPQFNGSIPGAASNLPISIPGTIAPQLSGAYGTAGTIGGQGGPLASLTASGVPSYLNNYIFQNPGQSGYLTGSRTAANMGTTGATTAFNAGQNLYAPGFQTIAAGQSLVPFATALETQAFDPQSALYNQQVQNLTDQINVANSQSGVSTSPYGASVEANALGNFNLNWQNNLLNRMATGANAASGLINTAAGATSTGAGVIGNAAQIAGTAPLSYLQASGLPYSTYNQLGLDKINAAGAAGSSLLSAQGPLQQGFSDVLGVTGAETGVNQSAVQAYQAQIQAYDAQLAAQQQQFLQNQAYGKALGGGLSLLSGGGTGGFGSGSGTGGNLWSGLNFGGSPLWSGALNMAGINPYNPG